MSTLTWTTTGTGSWTDGANWSGGAAPVAGDTTFVSEGVPLITGALSDEIIWLNQPSGTAQLDFGGATLDSTSFIGVGGNSTIFCVGTNSDAGSIQYDSATGMLQLYLGGGTAAFFDNTGQLNLDGNAAVMGMGTFTNDTSGVVSIVNFNNTQVADRFDFIRNFINDGMVRVDGSAATLASSTVADFSSVAGTGIITVDHAGVSISGATALGSSFGFMGNSGTLTLNAGQSTFSSIIAGFEPGDTIDLNTGLVTGLAVTNMAYTPGLAGLPGTLVFAIDRNDVPFTDFTLDIAGNYQQSDFSLTQIAQGGQPDYIVTTSAPPCYAAGTRIATPAGPVEVERLRAGDLVLSAFGGSVPVTWIGHRHVDCRRHPRPQDVRPVCVRAGAFGAGAPSRDLFLSPDHAVLADGVLVPVRYLLNGATVAQTGIDRVTYFHVELPAHDVLLAEGLPAESYLDTGNRGAFVNAAQAVHLHPDFALNVWQAQACAELVRSGPSLAAIKASLLRQAESLGHGISTDPGLTLLADGVSIPTIMFGQTWHAALSHGVREVRLESRVWVPAHMNAASDDVRALGAGVTAIRLDGDALDLTGPALAAGWYDVEACGTGSLRWTGGSATLRTGGARSIAIELAPMGRYWTSCAASQQPACFTVSTGG